VASRLACIWEAMVPDLGWNIGYSGSGCVVFLPAIIEPADILKYSTTDMGSHFYSLLYIASSYFYTIYNVYCRFTVVIPIMHQPSLQQVIITRPSDAEKLQMAMP
jgi:hypothetical protein